MQPTNGQKNGESYSITQETVRTGAELRLYLRQKRKQDGVDRRRSIYEEFFDYSLGGCYFQNYRRRKYLELKDLEVTVSRIEEP
jgi:hypothetical protein